MNFEFEMFKLQLMYGMSQNKVDTNDLEQVRNYLVEVLVEGEPSAQDMAFVESMMAHLGFGPDESEYVYDEIFRLKDMLDNANIPYQMSKGPTGGYQIRYMGRKNIGNVVCSVIETPSSYGIKEDLLEIKGLVTKEEMEREQDVVLGYLTAENVFDRINKDYNKEITMEELNDAITNFLKMWNDSGNTNDFSAILKLKDMLDEADIPYEFKKHQFGEGYHLEYKVNGRQIYSIIQTNFSYGSKEGKVEIMGNGIDAIPFDVEEAFKIIQEYHNKK